MNHALEAFQEALSLTNFNDPRIPVYSNYDGVVYKDSRTVKKILPKQMVKCVKWEQSLNTMLKYKEDDFVPNIIEVGPGNSLTSMLKQVNGKWAKKSSFVEA